MISLSGTARLHFVHLDQPVNDTCKAISAWEDSAWVRTA